MSIETRERVIWKWGLALKESQAITMPRGAELLTVQIQGKQPTLWALVNPDEIPVKREIAIRGTGHECDDERFSKANHIGTVQLSGLVFHVFDMGEAK